MKIYLAGPFFNDEQQAILRIVGGRLEVAGHQVYYPMHYMILRPNASDEERGKVFRENKQKICSADMIVAVLDHKDQGTTWEMGFAHGITKPTIAVYYRPAPKVNVMLGESCIALCNGLYQLEEWLKTGAVQPFKGATE
jgi:nucleoside 2-deoxyribosyltransferase